MCFSREETSHVKSGANLPGGSPCTKWMYARRDSRQAVVVAAAAAAVAVVAAAAAELPLHPSLL